MLWFNDFFCVVLEYFFVEFINVCYIELYVGSGESSGVSRRRNVNIDRLREYFRGLSGEVHRELVPQRTVQRFGDLVSRGRRLRNRIMNNQEERVGIGKRYLRSGLIGGSRSVTQFLDGELVPQRSKPKKVVKRRG